MKQLLSIMVAAAMLTACGGGGGGGNGGGGGGSSNISSVPHIPWAVNSAAARRLITGSAAPSQTFTQGIAELITIGDNASSVIAGNVIVGNGITQENRFPYSCSGLSCSADVFGQTFSISGAGDGGNPSTDFGYDEEDSQLVMAHNGVTFFQVRARQARGTDNQTEVLVYGGWMNHSVFAIEATFFPSAADPEVWFVENLVFGNSPGVNPSDILGSTATWTGAVIGASYGIDQNIGNLIQGTATVDVDFTNTNVDVSFSNLVDLDNPSRSISNMDWANIPLSNGDFTQGSAGQNQIQGRFYGPNHEEVSGVFDRDKILGAFGAIRGRQ